MRGLDAFRDAELERLHDEEAAREAWRERVDQRMEELRDPDYYATEDELRSSAVRDLLTEIRRREEAAAADQAERHS